MFRGAKISCHIFSCWSLLLGTNVLDDNDLHGIIFAAPASFKILEYQLVDKAKFYEFLVSHPLNLSIPCFPSINTLEDSGQAVIIIIHLKFIFYN